jgi:hypothetical protein
LPVTGLDGAIVHGVAPFDGGVMAVGSVADGPAAWTSKDGVTWNRQDLAREMFAPDEEINELATVGERIFAVGATPQGGAVVDLAGRSVVEPDFGCRWGRSGSKLTG